MTIRVTKGTLFKVVNGAITSRFTFQFNPSERSESRDVNYSITSPPGSYEPDCQFVSVSGSKIELRLLLDATYPYEASKQGTRAQKAWLEQFTQPDVDTMLTSVGRFTPPPDGILSMGGKSSNVKVMHLGFKDVVFNPDLIETRTWVDLTMQTIFKDLAQQQAYLMWMKDMASKVGFNI